MEAELIYKSEWCKAEPMVSEPPEDEIIERFIGKIFANRTNRLIVKNDKYYYVPSEEYQEHVAKMRKVR